MSGREFLEWVEQHFGRFPNVREWVYSFNDAKPPTPVTILAGWLEVLEDIEKVDAFSASRRMAADLTLRPDTPQDTAAFVLQVANEEKHKRIALEKDAAYDQPLLPGTKSEAGDQFFGHLNWAFTRDKRPRRIDCFHCKDRGLLRLSYLRNGEPFTGIAACVCEAGTEQYKNNAHMNRYQPDRGVAATDIWDNPYDGSPPAIEDAEGVA